MSRFTRFLRVAVLPLAVLATVAGTSVSASAATLDTPAAPIVTVSFHIGPFSMNW